MVEVDIHTRPIDRVEYDVITDDISRMMRSMSKLARQLVSSSRRVGPSCFPGGGNLGQQPWSFAPTQHSNTITNCVS